MMSNDFDWGKVTISIAGREVKGDVRLPYIYASLGDLDQREYRGTIQIYGRDLQTIRALCTPCYMPVDFLKRHMQSLKAKK